MGPRPKPKPYLFTLLAIALAGLAYAAPRSSNFPASSGGSTDNTKVLKAGDTMTGDLILSGPTADVVAGASVTASAFFGDGSKLTGIPSTSSISGVYAPLAGATFTGASGITNQAFTATGPNGNIVSGASVTASAFFGDGAGLTNTPGEAAAYANPKTFSAVGGSTYSVTSSSGIYLNAGTIRWPDGYKTNGSPEWELVYSTYVIDVPSITYHQLSSTDEWKASFNIKRGTSATDALYFRFNDIASGYKYALRGLKSTSGTAWTQVGQATGECALDGANFNTANDGGLEGDVEFETWSVYQSSVSARITGTQRFNDGTANGGSVDLYDGGCGIVLTGGTTLREFQIYPNTGVAGTALTGSVKIYRKPRQ